jgi:hypothetical protein
MCVAESLIKFFGQFGRVPISLEPLRRCMAFFSFNLCRHPFSTDCFLNREVVAMFRKSSLFRETLFALISVVYLVDLSTKQCSLVAFCVESAQRVRARGTRHRLSSVYASEITRGRADGYQGGRLCSLAFTRRSWRHVALQVNNFRIQKSVFPVKTIRSKLPGSAHFHYRSASS